jgi:two-component system, NarL family, sensor histidine kinase DesK
MADALLTSGREPADHADSEYVLQQDPADPDPRPGRGRPARGHGRPRASMTAAPARPQVRAADIESAPPGPAEGLMQPTRWYRVGWLFAAIWLVYLAQPATHVWAEHDLVRRYLGLATLLAFAAVFVAAFAVERSLRRRGGRLPLLVGVAVLAAQAALVAVGYLTIGPEAGGLFIYVSVMAVFLLPTGPGWLVVAACIIASLAVPGLVHGWQPDGTLAFQVFVSALAAWGVVQLIQRNMQLTEARNEITRLALAGERNRFARDLHDILGHSLTVVAVKAELAGRLASLDPARAEAEIADVERIAREALADVRAAAAGYREVTLCEELASARTALAAAGIEADLPDQVVDVPRDRQDLFGWAVREGVTNVVRHSGATRCRIRVTPSEIEISDDGRGPGGRADASPADRLPAPQQAGDQERPPGGHGLTGLRERADAIGAAVSVGRSALGGFLLRVRVP